MGVAKIDPDPVSIGLAILGVFGTYLGVGFAAESKLKEKRSNHEGFEDQIADLTRKIRRDLRQLQDEWEDIYSLIEYVSESSKNGYLEGRFKAGDALLLTQQEMVRYVNFKIQINSTICRVTGSLNSAMNVIVVGNPKKANVYLEELEFVERKLNLILLEGCGWMELSDNINLCIERISQSLRKNGNR